MENTDPRQVGGIGGIRRVALQHHSASFRLLRLLFEHRRRVLLLLDAVRRRRTGRFGLLLFGLGDLLAKQSLAQAGRIADRAFIGRRLVRSAHVSVEQTATAVVVAIVGGPRLVRHGLSRRVLVAVFDGHTLEGVGH